MTLKDELPRLIGGQHAPEGRGLAKAKKKKRKKVSKKRRRRKKTPPICGCDW